MFSPNSRSRLFLVYFFWLLLVPLHTTFSEGLAAQSPPSAELFTQDSNILSDEQVAAVTTELAKTLSESERQLLIKLLKNFKARTQTFEQSTASSQSHLNEVQLNLTQARETVKSQGNLLQMQADSLTSLSTSLKDQERDRLIVCTEIGIACLATGLVLGLFF